MCVIIILHLHLRFFPSINFQIVNRKSKLKMTNKYDNVTVPPRRIESSNAIQILTPIRKIWRGNVWSEFKVKVSGKNEI